MTATGQSARLPRLMMVGLMVGLVSVSCARAKGPRRSCPPGAQASSAGVCVPEAWQCSPALYHAGDADGCDCYCGAPDPDCHKMAKTFWCYGLGMARQVVDCGSCAPGLAQQKQDLARIEAGFVADGTQGLPATP